MENSWCKGEPPEVVHITWKCEYLSLPGDKPKDLAEDISADNPVENTANSRIKERA